MKVLDSRPSFHHCPALNNGFDTTLIPWPGLKFACVKILQLYGKVFDQTELCELVIRKTCNNCKCPKEAHDIYHREWVNVNDRLGFKSLESEKVSSRQHLLEGYTWVPPGISSHKIEQYFRCLPQDRVPKINTTGEKYRDRQLVQQLPKQDLALAYCKNVEPKDHQSYDDFINARNEISLDVAHVRECTNNIKCPKCKQIIESRALGILAPKFGDGVLWHPDCFVCTECSHLLIDLTYCVYEEKLYCERHYAERLKPRCAACDEDIRF
ncbi:hypothetical protein PGB90_008271 [Kerria lacca]